jgi:cobalamin biosynthesis Co2+ chelatase CbiK|tara:strand:+ start:1129 stop:1281 length:153 start_codon:yes stop_codon:yes gene_type:complete
MIKQQLKEAIRLLTDLAELQNGTPLIRYEDEYNKTMDEVWDFIAEYRDVL